MTELVECNTQLHKTLQGLWSDALTQHKLQQHFYLFQMVIELNQPFQQTGTDTTQVHFCELLCWVTDSHAEQDDWMWLQTCHPSCLNSTENTVFNTHKHIVATNSIQDTSGKSWVSWALLNLFEPHLNSLKPAWARLAKCFLSKISS